MNTGKSLRICLVKADMNQSELAREMGLTRASINRYCRTKQWSMPSVERFANHFGLSVTDFIKLGED